MSGMEAGQRRAVRRTETKPLMDALHARLMVTKDGLSTRSPLRAIGRKNSLFCGNEDGGETWAILASLVNTAKLNGLDPQTYLTGILERVNGGAKMCQMAA